MASTCSTAFGCCIGGRGLLSGSVGGDGRRVRGASRRERDAGGPIHAGRGARPRRHGRGLPGLGPGAAAAGRGQDAAPRDVGSCCPGPIRPGRLSTLAKLTHPGLVTVLDAGTAGDRPFLVMELVDGAALSTWVRGAALDPRYVAAAGAQIADALRYVHGEGIVHPKDVTPAHILARPGRAGPAGRFRHRSPRRRHRTPDRPGAHGRHGRVPALRSR